MEVLVGNSNKDRETYTYRSPSKAALVGFEGELLNGGAFGRS